MNRILTLGIAIVVSGAVYAAPPAGVSDHGFGGPPWLQAGAALRAFDANGDGALSQVEVPAPLWQRLAEADGNEDGQVTLAEVANAVSARVMERFDENEDGALTREEAPERVWQRISQADSNNDGFVTVNEFGAAVELRLADAEESNPAIGGPPWARGGRSGPPPWLRAGAAFQRFDANQDGALNQEEVPALMWQRLADADGNEDGQVTLAEVVTAVSERIMERFDENEDGALTAEEAPGRMWQRLSQADANNDGFVTLIEFSAAVAVRLANVEESNLAVGGPPWARGGRFGSPPEAQGGGNAGFGRRGGGPPSPSRLLESFDANDNGELTADEVPAPVWQRLSAADLNDDGVVTEAELLDYQE